MSSYISNLINWKIMTRVNFRCQDRDYTINRAERRKRNKGD